MKKNIEMLFVSAHHSFLEQQTMMHKEYLHLGYKFYQTFLKSITNNLSQTHQVSAYLKRKRSIKKTNLFLNKPVNSSLEKQNKFQHQYLFDPKIENWVNDHCPTFTRAAIPMMSIVDILASQCEEYFPHKKLIALKEVRVFQWAIVDKAKMLTIEININDEENADAIIFLQKDGAKDILIAKGKLVFADFYMRPVSAPSSITKVIQDVKAPYRYLFHGPAFQCVRSLQFGAEGSTILLEAHNPLGPLGALNHILLDGATHGVYYEDGLSFWDKSLPDNHVCYPALIRYMHLYGPTPTQGIVRCETRFAGFHFSKTLPVFRMYLIVNDKTWCEFEIVYAVLPMGFMGKESLNHIKNFNYFIKERKYTTDVHLADFSSGKAMLTTKVIQKVLKAQWFPHLLEDIYQINDHLDIAALTRQFLTKDFFANQFQVHPSHIKIIDEHTVLYDKPYHYQIQQNDDEFTIELSQDTSNA